MEDKTLQDLDLKAHALIGEITSQNLALPFTVYEKLTALREAVIPILNEVHTGVMVAGALPSQ